MRITLFVGSVASHEEGRELTRLFRAHGTVVYAKVVPDPDFRRGDAGFEIVQMATATEAHDAVGALHNSEFHGRLLTVRAATAAEETAAGHPRMFESMNMRDDAEELS